MSPILRLAGLLTTGAGRDSRTPTILSVIGFSVSTAALLTSLGGLHAFTQHFRPGTDAAALYQVLAVTAVALLVVPILTLGSLAARVTVTRRDARLAALRLAGATSGQVTLLTLLEAAAQALFGAVLGAAVYVMAVPALGQLRFDGRVLGPDHVLTPPLWILGVVVGVVVLAVGSGVGSLGRVVVSPLGVAQRSRAGAVSALRLGLTALALLAFLVATKGSTGAGIGVLLLTLVGLVGSINLAGPWVVQLCGRLMARRASRATTLLAARRIVDDPRATWRSVSALGLGLIIAATAGGFAATARDHPDPTLPHLGTDVLTGAAIALVITALVAATATGVAQAGRIYDQRPQYAALVLAGASMRTLDRARLIECLAPLVGSLALASGFAVSIQLVAGQVPDATVLLPMIAAGIVALGLTLAAVLASTGLVRQLSQAA